ncbi:MAG: type II secretion system protein M [Gammaproteobacteria bacterium]|nr:type II secretion system protein M [Gammaproteobacteria bacterium]
MNDWLVDLAPRERVMLAAGAVLLVLLLLYVLIWAPIRSGYHSLQESVSAQRETVLWMQGSAQTIQRLKSNGGAVAKGLGGRSLLSVTDSTARAGGLGPALKRVEPEGGNSVRVWLEGAPFDVLIKWLGTLSTQHGVDANSVSLERNEADGLVDARLTLEATP